MRSRFGRRAGIGVLALAVGAGLALAEPPEGKGRPDEGGNNLSYPVIWAEGVTKALLGAPGQAPAIGGVWWYWWGTEGTDPDVYPLSCLPDPDDELFCDDGEPGTTDETPGAGYVRAYIQKDPDNVWQAGSATPAAAGVAEVDGSLVVDWIDWGDNLESADWYTRSQVRTEVVLFKDNPDPGFVPTPEYNPWLEFEMRHVAGWGVDEVHGLAAAEDSGEPPALTPMIGPGTRATVYSHCARLTIQKLLVERENPLLADLEWVPMVGWDEPGGYGTDLINPFIFNLAVHEGAEGPGYYAAEINVKGRVIYGYTWNVRQMNDTAGGTAAGDYRVTFSLDETCGVGVEGNTFFADGTTQILDSEVEAAESEPEGGGVAVLDSSRNLTYIDVRIHERGGGGGGSTGGARPGGRK